MIPAYSSVLWAEDGSHGTSRNLLPGTSLLNAQQGSGVDHSSLSPCLKMLKEKHAAF